MQFLLWLLTLTIHAVAAPSALKPPETPGKDISTPELEKYILSPGILVNTLKNYRRETIRGSFDMEEGEIVELDLKNLTDAIDLGNISGLTRHRRHAHAKDSIVAPLKKSHTLWYTPSQPHHRLTSTSSSTNSNTTTPTTRRQQHGSQRAASALAAAAAASASADSLATLLLEERALRIRKQNIAAFGYSWIRPAGCAKTMLGVREEEAEREEGAAAAAAEAEGVGLDGDGDFGDGGVMAMGMGDGVGGEMGERDLDDDIPDADGDADGEGLVEEGEEGLDDEGELEEDEEGLMGRDLDDDVPEGFGIDEDDDDEDDEDDDFDDQPDLDDDIPSAMSDEGQSMMDRDLDADIPSQAEDGIGQQQEWEHTDTDEDDDEEEDEDDQDMEVDTHATPQHYLRSSSSSAPMPHLPPHSSAPAPYETEAQRLFLQRWSGGGDISGASPGGDDSFGSPDFTPETNLRSQRRRPRRRSAMTTSSDSADL
ncbi:hypothetical protein FQN50_007906 [Emmonsiellopsis sp. PD_5]|nr:hypothetical protein FQN50_007906 [Emmonsiellopsis sp. PD_5]